MFEKDQKSACPGPRLGVSGGQCPGAALFGRGGTFVEKKEWQMVFHE